MTDHTGRDYVRADEGHAIAHLALPPALLPLRHHAECRRDELPPLPFKAFALHRLLTDAECASLVALAEQTGFRSISWEYDEVRAPDDLSFF